MKKILLSVCLVIVTVASAQKEYEITVESKQPSGTINEMLYGQLFEHIYFSANNGVWQELIQERSFEPEQYPGIPPRDGYFDGWYMDDNQVLHSPTRYEQPLRIDSIDTSDFDNAMWEMGIERYEKCVRDFSTAMRQIDPSIKIIACGGFQEDEQFIQRSGRYFDYLSLHHYERQEGYATGPLRLAQQYDRYARMIAEGPNPNIKLFISEWNLNSIDWRTGLFAGGFLNMCEARDVVAMGAAALFLRRTDAPDWNNAFINFDYKDLFKAPNCQVTELWYDHFSRYRLAHSGDTGDLSVSTTLSEDGGEVIVKVVNPSDAPATLRVRGDWPAVTGTLFEYYAPGSLTVANSMADKQAVALQRATPATDGCDVLLAVPALSAGVLTITK